MFLIISNLGLFASGKRNYQMKPGSMERISVQPATNLVFPLNLPANAFFSFPHEIYVLI
jgi:hypothetical protein